MQREPMNRFHMPPQIVRLVLLTIGIIGSYIVARHFMTPSSFGEYGFYRGDALMERASLPAEFAGKKACIECHEPQGEQLAKAGHKSLSCEACHGPLAWHAADPLSGKLDKNQVISDCLRCHEANPTRPKIHKQIVAKDHYSGDKCSECHQPHVPMEN
jgi:hypothetical protein